MSSLYLTGIAPSAMAALSKAQKACIAAGAFASRVLSFFRLLMLYTAYLHLFEKNRNCTTDDRGIPRRAPSWLTDSVRRKRKPNPNMAFLVIQPTRSYFPK